MQEREDGGGGAAAPRSVSEKELQKALRRMGGDHSVIYVPDVEVKDLAPRLVARASGICPLMREAIPPPPPEDSGTGDDGTK